MDVIWLLLVFGCVFVCGERGSTEPNEEKAFGPELFPPKPTFAGQTRMPRTLFKKLHSGAAFLAGLKLGAVLSKKGFELGHGKIASSHSFQVFGKSVNSAMSLAYGDASSLLPLVDDEPDSQAPKTTADEKVFHVTVVEKSSEGPKKEPIEAEGSGEKEPEVSRDEEPEVERGDNFLEDHNKLVKEFNDSLLKRKHRRL